jgi:polyisoprenoid-binding protein YceI
MKKITFFLAFLLVSVGAFAQTTWTADPFHSRLGFSVTHLGISDIDGHFSDYEVTISATKADFSDASIELTVQTESINTRIDPRDKHLRSADFFDVEKYPTMTFKSTSVKKSGKDTYTLTGNLTLIGQTKPVTMTMKYRGTTANPNANGAPVAGIQITGEFKRSDFGFGGQFPEAVISDVVRIKADGEFVHKK